MKILIFGTGKIANDVMNNLNLSRMEIQIIGFIDNDNSKYAHLFFGRKIYSVVDAVKLNYDYICILVGDKYQEIYNQLTTECEVESRKIIDRLAFLKLLMVEKYKKDDRSFVDDTLEYWKKHPISFMNQFQYTKETYENVFWDKENDMPYIMLGDKRLYYPQDYSDFIEEEGQTKVVSYRAVEQHPASPHRYLKDYICIQEGDVVVDAGAREGDFALPYIESIRKLYLFECDLKWVRALQMTYKDYLDKVVIIPKMLTDYESEETTTLDAILKEEKINFLKMDIEGAEVKALEAARKTLDTKNIRCSICSYHRTKDEEVIFYLLKEAGFECALSEGYVVFIDDPHIFRDLDFRKAIVYAHK